MYNANIIKTVFVNLLIPEVGDSFKNRLSCAPGCSQMLIISRRILFRPSFFVLSVFRFCLLFLALPHVQYWIPVTVFILFRKSKLVSTSIHFDKMLVSVVSWAFVWHYISHNFHQGMEIFGIKHTPRKMQAEEDDIRRWKFSNTRTSLIHSIISGDFFSLNPIVINLPIRALVLIYYLNKYWSILGFEFIWFSSSNHGMLQFRIFHLW